MTKNRGERVRDCVNGRGRDQGGGWVGEGEGEGVHHDGGTPAPSMSLLQQQNKVRKYWHIYVTYTYICNFASMQILRTMNMHALSVSSTMSKVQEIVNLPVDDFLLYVVIHMQ